MEVSVVVPTYNHEEYIEEAVDSLLEQTRLPDEVILIDDASNDSTQELVREYGRNHPGLIDAVVNEENIGVAGNFNKGVALAEGDLISFLAGDDKWLPRKLEKELETYLNSPDSQVIFSDFYLTTKDGEVICRWSDNGEPPTGYVLKEVFTREWPRRALYRFPLMDRKTFVEAGGFDENLDGYEDWDYKMRLAAETEVAYCPEPLSIYRKHDEGISNQMEILEHREIAESLYNKNRHLLQELPEKERKYVDKCVRGFFLRHEVLDELRKGRKKDAFKAYLRYLRCNRSGIKRYKLQLRIILPDAVYSSLKNIYAKLQGKRSRNRSKK